MSQCNELSQYTEFFMTKSLFYHTISLDYEHLFYFIFYLLLIRSEAAIVQKLLRNMFTWINMYNIEKRGRERERETRDVNG